MTDYLPAGRCSSISCRRSGKRSMARVISRTLPGLGLAHLHLAVLVHQHQRKARAGRSLWRTAVRAAGSVSVITTTSRSSSGAEVGAR